jgi:hypothetical protein
MSRIRFFPIMRRFTRSIQRPGNVISASVLTSLARRSVSKRPIWLVEAA